MAWQNREIINPLKFKCGWCGSVVEWVHGYYTGTGTADPKIYVCPNCDNPSFFKQGAQIPGVSAGKNVGHLPQDVDALYKEARACCSASCYTASVLLSRKLLMNIGVAQGADPGKPFVSYIEHLASNGYVPPNGRGWVDHIRKKGNEATHEIAMMSREDAEELITLSEMLLKFIYEFPNRVLTSSAVNP